MKLKEWIKTNKTSVKAFAERIGVHEGSVSRYIGGNSTPNTKTMHKIIEVTEGNVTFEDFLRQEASV